MKMYLSGPMTGMAENNFPAFHDAAAKLRAGGHEVVNPAELGECQVSSVQCPVSRSRKRARDGLTGRGGPLKSGSASAPNSRGSA